MSQFPSGTTRLLHRRRWEDLDRSIRRIDDAGRVSVTEEGPFSLEEVQALYEEGRAASADYAETVSARSGATPDDRHEQVPPLASLSAVDGTYKLDVARFEEAINGMDLKIGRGLALLTGLFFGGLAAVDLPQGGYAIAFIIPIAAALLALRWPVAGGVMLVLASGYHAVVQYENYATMAPDAHPGAALANGIILLVLPTLVPGVLLVVAALRRRPRPQTVRRPA